MTRPPNDRGQGRKPLVPGVETVVYNLRLTPDQKSKLLGLGGAKWLRQQIDRARKP